jgi:hypothetical protein
MPPVARNASGPPSLSASPAGHSVSQEKPRSTSRARPIDSSADRPSATSSRVRPMLGDSPITANVASANAVTSASTPIQRPRNSASVGPPSSREIPWPVSCTQSGSSSAV